MAGSSIDHGISHRTRLLMLLQYLGDLLRDPAHFLATFPLVFLTVGGALLVAITTHEFSHALVATSLGDITPRRLGRLSLNPLAHLDPAGTVMLLLVGFGWGKPVPVNPLSLRPGPRTGMALVSCAGPASNLFAAILCALPFHTGVVSIISPFASPSNLESAGQIVSSFLAVLLLYNLVLAIFNLIPLAPLDGFKIVLGILPPNVARKMVRLEPYGPMILMTIVALDLVFNVGILGQLIWPALAFLLHLLLGGLVF